MFVFGILVSRTVLIVVNLIVSGYNITLLTVLVSAI